MTLTTLPLKEEPAMLFLQVPGSPYLAPQSEPQHGGSRKSPGASTALALLPQPSGDAGDPKPGSSCSSPLAHRHPRPASHAQRCTRRSGRDALPAPAAPAPAGSGSLACGPGVSPHSRYAAAGTACRRFSQDGYVPCTWPTLPPSPYLAHFALPAVSSWVSTTLFVPSFPPRDDLAPVS